MKTINVSVRLDAGTVRVVERLARRRSQTRSEVIRDAIEAMAQPESEGPGRRESPYDRVAHVIGSVRGGPRDLSVQTGRTFRAILSSRDSRR